MTGQAIKNNYQLHNSGLDTIMVSWPGQNVAPRLLAHVAAHLQASLSWIIDLTVSQEAIQCRYNILERLYHDAKNDIKQALQSFEGEQTVVSNIKKVRIPVCYHPSLAPDLERVLQQCALSEDAFKQLHSRTEYSVAMIGFAPGFGYLQGLPEELQLPRLKSPRVSVPRGSIAIADQYSAVYPQTSPGGWSLVGKTPISLFNPAIVPPCLLSVGATVKFDVIELDEYKAMEQELSAS